MPVLKSQPVPAFYDNEPHFIPLLTSQVEIAPLPTQRIWVTASESMTLTVLNILSRTSVEVGEKTPKATTHRAKMPIAEDRAMTPGVKMPRVTTPREQTSRGPTPTPTNKQKSVTIEDPPSDSERSEGSPTPSESSLSSLESELGAGDKIPKPNGEAGRPGRRGYNLEEQLSWGEDSFKSLKFVNKVIKKHLDTTKCRSQQDRKALNTVCELATATFPDLDSFQNCWPVLDLIQMRLKYLSSRARQKQRIGTDSSSEVAKGEKRRDKLPKSKSPVPLKK
ncbi:hypothetical protein PISMIDRAFT_15091 [Pisolithus microcarpus 441]|uniref:Uncharacterized protein n=1 Tax=Pisolithus microcarpus 441 TaxID=765257 RepID=A0A0C9YTX4_9AGAM|nr:hypothetical protein BKA83DRAFT_15091 [Pisolithus microcarpus]KIK17459.1 hypothetical protein PISMIDRAFT_15091 [Pisolithus microcarpus 441]